MEFHQPKKTDPDLGHITWKNEAGQVCREEIRASELRNRIKILGSRKMPTEESQKKANAQVELWCWLLEQFGKVGAARPDEAPIDRYSKVPLVHRARTVEELTP